MIYSIQYKVCLSKVILHDVYINHESLPTNFVLFLARLLSTLCSSVHWYQQCVIVPYVHKCMFEKYFRLVFFSIFFTIDLLIYLYVYTFLYIFLIFYIYNKYIYIYIYIFIYIFIIYIYIYIYICIYIYIVYIILHIYIVTLYVFLLENVKWKYIRKL